MRGRWILVLVLLAPTAAAGVPFVREYGDPFGDNPAKSADIVRFVSTVADGRVTQRVEMAAAPDPVLDTVILRSWFHDSANGSFHVVDLEVHAHEAGEGKFRALVRRGDFENVTPIDAGWAIEGTSWVFTFDEALVADATCYDPILWAQHEPEDGRWTNDVGGVGTRHCRVRGDPAPSPPAGTAPEYRFPDQDRPEPIDPPGSYAPSPLPWLALALALLLTRRTWRRS